MDLKEFFSTVIRLLKTELVRYALAGGLVASLYRRDQRLTNDLDFLILSTSQTQQKATRIIRALGLHPHVIRRADLEGGLLFAVKKGSTPPWIITGRGEGDPTTIGLDFILPEVPWFESALSRAEQNAIDFGFGPVACLTVEDVIIAKLFALKNDQHRFNDLDDLQSIFLAGRSLDLAYLSGQMQRLGLQVPTPIRAMAPKTLTLVSRKIT